MKLSTLRALMANIAISFSICSPKYLNKAFLVLNFKFFTQHETFTFKRFEGIDFKFDTHSYSSHNIQTKCVGPNDKVTLFRWRYFIFINLKLLISNFDIECVNNILKFLLKWNFEILWNFDSFTRKYIHGYWINQNLIFFEVSRAKATTF